MEATTTPRFTVRQVAPFTWAIIDGNRPGMIHETYGHQGRAADVAAILNAQGGAA